METTADNLLGNSMPAHLYTVGYTGKRQFNIRNPKKKKMDGIAFFFQIF